MVRDRRWDGMAALPSARDAAPPPRSADGTNPRLVVTEGLREEDVALIVHDLKNPLATIALEVEILDERLQSTAAQPEARGALRRIASNVAFLDHMVHDLLDLASIDHERFEIHRAPTELRTLLEVVVERCVATRDRPRVVIEAPMRAIAVVDGVRLQRVVTNFLLNALKYAPACSSIVVRLDADDTTARVSVLDAGPGMTADEAAFVFDKDRRGTAARTRDGSGLGLFVSRRIVEAHGGTIGVDTIRGTGSRFFFEVPIAG